jgi:hypothetical protein
MVLYSVKYKWVAFYGVYMSQAVRNRRNRNDNKVTGSEVFGGVQIRATEYCTGRCDVQIQTVPVTNAQRAAYVFGE